MDIIFVPLLRLLISVINFYVFGLFVYVIMSLLEQFGIINRYNQFVYLVHTFLFRIYEPVLGRIRVFMPQLGGLDLSPMVLMFLLYFVQDILGRLLMRFPF